MQLASNRFLFLVERQSLRGAKEKSPPKEKAKKNHLIACQRKCYKLHTTFYRRSQNPNTINLKSTFVLSKLNDIFMLFFQ